MSTVGEIRSADTDAQVSASSPRGTGAPGDRGRIRRSRRERDDRRKTWIMSTVGVLLLAFPLGPIVWMVSTAFKPNSEVFASPPRLIAENPTLQAFANVLFDPEKLRIFGNSYLVATCTVILTLLLAVHAAYAFSRFEFPGKRIINVCVIATQAVPPITLLIPFLGLIVLAGLFNSYAGLILVYIVFTLPYCTIMLTAYFNGVPRELDESVKVDGGNAFTALWRVIIPVSGPGLVSVGVYAFIIAWNEYLFALSLTRTIDMRTVPIGIDLLMGQHAYEWNEIMAMSILGCLPVIVVFAIFQRYVVAGLAAGAVKG
ncbi:carbohydrate ABC transporter permease [Agromyces aerolatus]|uniref:carbohydrate ABC transporter permease n=1 Tax=Agromyces sp. LY-1074 TaxID=3074080 RepID=UPI00285B190F|nr:MULTISPECIES: carbohydrate ABC transporter permease [unclassified Agromyces]MDR5700897.1 carbohydrate ABC transporter permease [Agromyces sp. LY-1074]MDR5707442.1 carbohydrate ABC transporter permease [Agromyces sp. LY-1358]